MDICHKGYLIDRGEEGHNHITRCKNRGMFKTLTSLDRVKANENGTFWECFFVFWGSSSL